jgi:hypothetical protein
MNLTNIVRRTIVATALGLSFAPVAQVGASNNLKQIGIAYSGTDGNWFNPANWSRGRVPGPDDDVVLEDGDDVVIDPALGKTRVQIRDLRLSGNARLETLAGTIMQTRNEVVQDQAQIIYRSSGVEGDTLTLGNGSAPRCGYCGGGIKLNPTPQSKRTVVLQSSATLDFGLGGREPASLTKTGAGRLVLAGGYGYHATLITARIDRLPNNFGAVPQAELKLSLHYGFTPAAGDSFQVITVTEPTRGATSPLFRGLPEGGLAGCTDNNVGLYISYVGGDGNDVVLSARATQPLTCLLLPAVQKIREAAVTQTREHILLARQVGTP